MALGHLLLICVSTRLRTGRLPFSLGLARAPSRRQKGSRNRGVATGEAKQAIALGLVAANDVITTDNVLTANNVILF